MNLIEGKRNCNWDYDLIRLWYKRWLRFWFNKVCIVYTGFFEISGLAAKLGGICSKQYNVAIVTDSGVYRNTLIAIHELGHL